MARSRDLRIAEAAAHAMAKFGREYIAELRRQGKIKGRLYVIIKDGKKQVRRPFREA
jgi:hypothetical protein